MSTFPGTEVEDDKTMWVLRDPTWGREGTLEMVCQDDLEALDLELGFCLGLGLVGDDQLVLGLEEAPCLSHHRN